MTFQKLPNGRQFVAWTSGHCEFMLEAIYVLPNCEVNNKDQNLKEVRMNWWVIVAHRRQKLRLSCYFKQFKSLQEVCTASICFKGLFGRFGNICYNRCNSCHVVSNSSTNVTFPFFSVISFLLESEWSKINHGYTRTSMLYATLECVL